MVEISPGGLQALSITVSGVRKGIRGYFTNLAATGIVLPSKGLGVHQRGLRSTPNSIRKKPDGFANPFGGSISLIANFKSVV